MENETPESLNETPHAHHHHHHSAHGEERTYNIVYTTQDGTRHEEQVTGHGHHEAVAKVREKGATDILMVARADDHRATAIKVKKSPLMLILKVAAALIATALAYYLVVSLS